MGHVVGQTDLGTPVLRMKTQAATRYKLENEGCEHHLLTEESL